MYKNKKTFVFKMFYNIKTYFGKAPARQWTKPGETYINNSNNLFKISSSTWADVFVSMI